MLLPFRTPQELLLLLLPRQVRLPPVPVRPVPLRPPAAAEVRLERLEVPPDYDVRPVVVRDEPLGCVQTPDLVEDVRTGPGLYRPVSTGTGVSEDLDEPSHRL